MTDFVVRPYREEDREGCRRLWEELTAWHRQIYDDPGIGGTTPGLHFDSQLEKEGPDHFLVAVSGGEVVGLIGYIVSDEEIEVEPLVVSEAFRGIGIGSKLLDSVASRFEGAGIKFLNVRPVARNLQALEFFRKHGFDKVGRVELFIDYTGRNWKSDLKLFDLEFGY